MPQTPKTDLNVHRAVSNRIECWTRIPVWICKLNAGKLDRKGAMWLIDLADRASPAKHLSAVGEARLTSG